VQIVDARNPLLFRTEDLERYVLEVDPEKRNLLLVNKADLMTLEQRRSWAEWFEGQGIRFAFYSARLAKEAQETSHEEEEEDEEEEGSGSDLSEEKAEQLPHEINDLSVDRASDPSEDSFPQLQDTSSHSTSDTDPRTQILTVFELQSLFLRESHAPKGTFPLGISLIFRPRPHPPSENSRRSCRLPQRRQILHYKFPPRRKTGLCILHSRQNQTLPNHPSSLCHRRQWRSDSM
jgi:hypothetical protein